MTISSFGACNAELASENRIGSEGSGKFVSAACLS